MTNDVYVGETFDEHLKHHGILGMKWGVRRFQKYPAGYTGDGKYVGSNGEPRLPTKKEAKRDRQYNELKTKMKKWLVDAVESGDKRALKILKSVMDPKDYQTAYDTLVKKGVESATKTGDKKELKRFKEDLSKKEYRDAKAMAEFSQAVNDGDTRKMYSLIKKIDNENIKESALRVTAITDFRKKNLEAAKVESIMSAKINKAATTAQNVANLAANAKKIYDTVQEVKEGVVKRERAELEYAESLEKKEKEKAKTQLKEKMDKVAAKADLNEVMKYKEQMSPEQIQEAYKRIYLNPYVKSEVDKAVALNDSDLKERWSYLIGLSDAKKK